jgi:hypothetical protein
MQTKLHPLNKQDKAIDAKLAEWGIPYAAMLVCADYDNKGWGSVCDKFTVTLGVQSWDYYQGLGHRIAAWGVISDKRLVKSGKSVQGGKNHGHSIYCILPTAASVLYSLLLDGLSAEQTFSDWCCDFGYDTDSRKALNSYMTCQDTLGKLRKVFTPAQIDELQVILEDY